MARGNQGREVFRDAPDRQAFLASLDEACSKTGWGIHAYMLMAIHYQLLLDLARGTGPGMGEPARATGTGAGMEAIAARLVCGGK